MKKYYVTLKADVDICVTANSPEEAKNKAESLLGEEFGKDDKRFDMVNSIYFADTTEYVYEHKDN